MIFKIVVITLDDGIYYFRGLQPTKGFESHKKATSELFERWLSLLTNPRCITNLILQWFLF